MKSGIKTLAVITGPYTTAKLGAAITLASTAFGWALAYAAARSMLREIIQKARERGVLVVKVNPRGAPSLCPRCGKKLVGATPPRLLLCPNCGWKRGRDVPEVSWIPMKAWARRKSLGVGTDGRRLSVFIQRS